MVAGLCMVCLVFEALFSNFLIIFPLFYNGKINFISLIINIEEVIEIWTREKNGDALARYS